MKMPKISECLAVFLVLVAATSPELRAQNIAWGTAGGITGDSNLATNGAYFDAFLANTSASVVGAGALTVDGIRFNVATSNSSTTGTDGKITFVVTSGNNNQYSFSTFPMSAPSSPAFAAVMNSGGTFENGGTGAGKVTISGLTPGDTYSVQVFNYANDGDDGYTIFSGSPSVKIGNLPGLAGPNTYGEYATGQFVATGSTEYFNWNGDGSAYTVLGAISVIDLSRAVAPANNVAWGTARGITGDADLVTNGAYFDAFLPNTGSSVVNAGTLTADTIRFNVATSSSSTNGSDGIISFVVTSGGNNPYAFNTFPTAPPSSPAFAAVMDSGGTFENGGAGSGVIAISGLSTGHVYSVQVFNYSNDGDDGLTTLSGTPSVTIGNLPGLAGSNTYGEFATGVFTATSPSESFTWNGDGSGYTVIGPISVVDVTLQLAVSPAGPINQGDSVTLAVISQSSLPFSFQWQTDSGTGGADWTGIAGATETNYILDTGTLAVGTYLFRVTATDKSTGLTSSALTVTVVAPSAPYLVSDITPASDTQYIGQGATFSVAFNGNHPIDYQWQYSGDDGAIFQDLPGETNAILTVANLQLTNAGQYRLMAANALGTEYSSAAVLSVKPWSDAAIHWSVPVSIIGLSAGAILTNLPGSYLEAASFFYGSSLEVSIGTNQFTFRSDGAGVTVSGGGSNYSAGTAGYGSGALGAASTGDADLDAVLTQFYNNGSTNLIILKNLEAGQTYTVQLFALDNRAGATNELASFANPADPADCSATFTMGADDYVVATFTATDSTQMIQESLLNGGTGNINAVVVRALYSTPAFAPVILSQPQTQTVLSNHTARFTMVADAAPAAAYQWESGAVGGPYTNLMDSAKYAGTLTPALSISNVQPADGIEYVVAISNAAGATLSAPADLFLWTPSSNRPVVVACIGASDVSTPTPYGTPNWPVYIAPMLGSGYDVENFGASGTDMITNGDSPYVDTSQYTASGESDADIVIIMLGSNDSKPQNWAYQTNYVPDYERFIAHYRRMSTHPRIYLNTLLTAYPPGNYGITDPIVSGIISPWIRQIGYDEGCPVIDVNAATKDMPQNFPDDIHPNIAGAEVVAGTVYYGLIGNGETPPVFPQLSAALSGGQIQLDWPADHIGWRLETRTNSILPAIDSAWTTVANSAATNHVSVAVPSVGPPIFFRLAYP
jgi:lysophospholipase L1-like esterase